MDQNRRGEHRFPTDATVELSILYPSASGVVLGRILDVSRSGLRLEIGTSMSKGTRVQVKFGEVVVFGEVRHCREMEEGRFEAGLYIEELLSRSRTKAAEAAQS